MLRKLYNITATGGRTNTTQAVASFLHEYFSYSDLLAFQKEFAPLSAGRIPLVKVCVRARARVRVRVCARLR
jgi:hypothetical protein